MHAEEAVEAHTPPCRGLEEGSLRALGRAAAQYPDSSHKPPAAQARNPLGPGGASRAVEPQLRRMLYYLLLGTRGGATRARVLVLLLERPRNTNQVAEALRMDYKTAQHHLRLLEEHLVVVRAGRDYGAVYFPAPEVEAARADLGPILNESRKKER